MIKQRVWAVGMKNWIEIRSSPKPLRGIESILKKPYTISDYKWVPYYDYRTGIFEPIDIVEVATLKQIVYLGGRVICRIKRVSKKFPQVLKVRNGKVKEIGEPFAALFLNRGWRIEHGFTVGRD